MPKVDIRQGDALEVLRALPSSSFHAALTDPPYGLSELRNSRRASPRKSSRDRASGFMGMLWDSEVPGSALWAEVLRVLKPGALVLAFGGSRTHHRLMCNLEDAGFTIRDVMIWLYGQGFPKSKNLGEGYGSALKPAWEPIILCQVPFQGSLTETFIRQRTGSLWIDGTRVPHDGENLGGGRASTKSLGWDRPWKHDPEALARLKIRSNEYISKAEDLGRWPANAVLDEEAGEQLNEQTGTLTSGANPTRRNSDKFRNTYQPYQGQDCSPARGADTGGASRFYYCPKASSSDRGEGNEHPCVKPTKLTEYLSRLLLPPASDEPRRLLVPFSGSGSECLGAKRAGWDEIVGIDSNPAYVEFSRSRLEESVNG